MTEENRKIGQWWPPIDSVWADIRFAFRQLRQSPGFAITSVLTLSLGIAASVAIFGFVDSALIQPLPYPNSSRLVSVFETSPLSGDHMGYSYPNYFDLARGNRVFASTAAYDSRSGFILSRAGSAHLVNGIGVTRNFFRILGVAPILGKDFAQLDTEDLLAAPSTVLLSYAAWQHWFAGRSDVLGKPVTLNGESYSVIGVLPRSFQFGPTGAPEFWTTLRPFAADSCHLSRGCALMEVIARLKDGITLHAALTDVKAIAAEEARQHPDPDKNRGANVLPLSQWILGDIQPVLLALLAGASLLLLIAYVNVTALLFVRSETRRREFAVRGALGAGRRRLIQQFIVEGLVIAIMSAGLGLLASTATQHLSLKLIPADTLNSMPYLLGTGWNWHVAVFATVLILAAGVLFATVPVLQFSLSGLRVGLMEAGRGSTGTSWRRVGAKLVVVEIATTMVLLAGAGMLAKSFYELLHTDMGFVPNHLATLSVVAPDSKYTSDEQARLLQREVISRLKSLPGVRAVGTARDLPVTGVGSTQIGFVGKPGLGVNNEVGHQVISSEYLSALQAELLRGRYFNQNDNASVPLVAMINQTLAQRYFPSENPIGKQFFYHAHDIRLENSQPLIEIVGIIADVKEYALDAQARPVVYTPFEQGPSANFSLVVRTSQQAASVLPSVIATVHQIDPELVTADAATMPEIIQSSWAAYWHRMAAWLVGGFAGLALILSMVGLYGVIAYSVSQRTREIGLWMAVGATRSSVYRLILKQAGGFTFIGLMLGLSGSLAAGKLMRSLLFGVPSWDVSILGIVTILLITSTLLASCVPAKRAASVDPIEALRAE